MNIWYDRANRIAYIDYHHISYTDLWLDMFTPDQSIRAEINFKQIMGFYDL